MGGIRCTCGHVTKDSAEEDQETLRGFAVT